MKKIVLLIALFIVFCDILVAFDILEFSITFIDPARNNREIETEIFYPGEYTEKNAIDGEFPVIVFGHGWLMNYTNYNAVTQNFVPNGWIVAFPRTEEGLFPDHYSFALDLAFVAKSLQLLNHDSTSILYGLVSSVSIVMGHSMGGGCAVLSASESDIFSAVITLAAAETNPSAISAANEITIPTITYAASNDYIAPPATHQLPIYQNLASQYKSYVSLIGEGHIGINSNTIVFNSTNPFLDYILSFDLIYLIEFESVLESYSNAGEITYEIENQLFSTDDPAFQKVVNLDIFPHPSTGQVVMHYSVVKHTHVRIDIFDIRGRKVRMLIDLEKEPGYFSSIWNGLDDSGNEVHSGMFFVQLRSDGITCDNKMIYFYK